MLVSAELFWGTANCSSTLPKHAARAITVDIVIHEFLLAIPPQVRVQDCENSSACVQRNLDLMNLLFGQISKEGRVGALGDWASRGVLIGQNGE